MINIFLTISFCVITDAFTTVSFFIYREWWVCKIRRLMSWVIDLFVSRHPGSEPVLHMDQNILSVNVSLSQPSCFMFVLCCDQLYLFFPDHTKTKQDNRSSHWETQNLILDFQAVQWQDKEGPVGGFDWSENRWIHVHAVSHVLLFLICCDYIDSDFLFYT